MRSSVYWRILNIFIKRRCRSSKRILQFFVLIIHGENISKMKKKTIIHNGNFYFVCCIVVNQQTAFLITFSLGFTSAPSRLSLSSMGFSFSSTWGYFFKHPDLLNCYNTALIIIYLSLSLLEYHVHKLFILMCELFEANHFKPIGP